MKTKILLLLLFLSIFYTRSEAQFSFTNISNEVKEKEKNNKSTLSLEVKKTMTGIIDSTNDISATDKESFKKSINNSQSYNDVTRAIEESSIGNNQKSNLKSQTYDVVIQNGGKENAKNDRSLIVFFPGRFNGYGSEVATYFFEGKEEYTQLFQNNDVVYNPNLKNLSFNSEVVNDYLGPVRIGIGFQFSSTVKNNDSIATAEEKKDKLVASLQNGGGNLFINIKYPIISLGEQDGAFGLKSFFYHNSGVELTKINESDNDFLLTNNTGITIGAFGRGKKGDISVFVMAKAAILYGNFKYNKVLAIDEDFKKVLPMFNVGIGLNFSDIYTVKAEFYPSGDYIKRNFPATISFVINSKK